MSLRSKARACALQMLFQWDASKQDAHSIEDGFWRMTRAADTTRKFANELFEGATAGVPELDVLLAAYTKDWRVERLAATDRAILRLAIYELCAGKTPPKVVLNEAIELAKQFSGEEAAPFLNGILDSVWRALKEKKEGRTASGAQG